jgi:branched-chain amino acid transport system substrate-binding protein
MTPAVVPVPGSYDFSAGVANDDLTRAAIRYFRERGWTRIATITATDATGQDNDKAIDAILALPENKDVALLDREHFGITDLSVDAQIVRIKASGAQVLIIGTAGTPTGTILRSIANAGLTIPVGINYGNATHAQMTGLAAYLPKELYFFGTAFLSPGQVTDRTTKRAVDQYDAALTALGYKPDASQVAGYETAMIAAYVLNKAGPNPSAERVRDEIAKLRGWVGVNGPYDFTAYPQRGLGPNTAMISRWDAATQTWIGVSKPGGDVLK